MKDRMRVGYVCTNYNNSSYTRDAIASLHAGSRGNDVRVVVVDNNSQDADIAKLREVAREFPGVELILNQDNVGYFPRTEHRYHASADPVPRYRAPSGWEQRPGVSEEFRGNPGASPRRPR